jgi:hypothetical protein
MSLQERSATERVHEGARIWDVDGREPDETTQVTNETRRRRLDILQECVVG